MNHRLTRPGVVLIVLAQTTGAVQPPERPLDLPPVGQHLEGPQLLRLADQLQSLAAETLGPADHWLVCPIGPDQPQPREPAHDLGQHELRAGRVLNARGVDHERQQQTQGINQDVPFTSLDSLASVVAAGASHLGRLHGLAVDDGGAGAFVSAGLVPDLGPQGVLDRLPRAIATPLPIVVMDRSPWGKVVGKHPPLDAAADEIEDGVEDFAPVDGLRPPSRFGLGNQGLDQLLLGIGQIGGVFCASHTLFYAQNKG